MFKLIHMTKNVPKSLFIPNVTNLESINAGGFGRIFKGLHRGQIVAVKELYNTCHDVRGFPFFPFNTDFLKRIHSERTCVEKLLYGDLYPIALYFLFWEYMKGLHSYPSFHHSCRMGQ